MVLHKKQEVSGNEYFLLINRITGMAFRFTEEEGAREQGRIISKEAEAYRRYFSGDIVGKPKNDERQ